MNVAATIEATTETPRVLDAASCRTWLARLATEETGRLLQVDRLMRGLVRSTQAPDLVLEIAEQARPVHLAELDGVIERLDASAFPMGDSDRARLSTALESLRLGRNLYRQVHAQLLGDSEAAAHAVIPGAASSPRAAMPLARALDYQARLLLALQRLKVAVDAAEWDEFCSLAQQLRASTFIDVRLPDEAPLLKAGTSRALFVYPLLVWLAEPYTRTPAEFALVARLARRWAGRVGFRLEEGEGSSDTRHGPSIALSERHTVRLVTHRLQRSIETRLREIEASGSRSAPRLPRGLTLQATRRLLSDLAHQWCEPRLLIRTPQARLGEMRLRFGFPMLAVAGDASPAAGASAGGRRAGAAASRATHHARAPRPSTWHSAASRAYIYGRFEHDTLIRLAIGGPRRIDPLRDWAAGAQAADWVSIERQQAVFEGGFAQRGIELGALALLVPSAIERDPAAVDRNDRAHDLPKRIFGRVVSVGQRLSGDARQPASLRVSVALWLGLPMLVGVRAGDDPFFHDAFLLVPEPVGDGPTSLVLAEGSFHAPAVASLREAERDYRIRLEELLDRGPGYDRVRISRLPG